MHGMGMAWRGSRLGCSVCLLGMVEAFGPSWLGGKAQACQCVVWCVCCVFCVPVCWLVVSV